MVELRSGEWARALAHVERAVQDCLGSLAKYEAAFAHVLAEAGRVAPWPTTAHEDDGEWRERIAEAEGQHRSAEALLDEQDRLWAEWQSRYGRWADSLKQPPE